MSDIIIQQGATFRRTYRWGSSPIIYKNISAVTKAAPCRLTVTAHGVPDGWHIAITNVAGMLEINAANTPPEAEDYYQATVVDANTIELNTVNSLGFSAATANTGAIQYMTPVNLSTYTVARLQIRKTTGAEVVELELTEASGITINNAAKTIEIEITATEAAALDFISGVFDLEIESTDGTVVRLDEGCVLLDKEVVRP